MEFHPVIQARVDDVIALVFVEALTLIFTDKCKFGYAIELG